MTSRSDNAQDRLRRIRAVLPFAILAVGVLGAALLVALRPVVEPRPAEPRRPLVRAQIAAPRAVQLSVRTHGTVVPRTESELVAQVPGEVVWVSRALVSGGFFEAEQPLVRLERADAEAELESAAASVARAESEFRRAEKERARQRRLADRSVASQARIDDAENAFRVAEAVLREARARTGRAERDLARTELRAPFAGRVRDERVDVGQFVSRGTAIATLYAVDFAEVRLPIPDRELAYLELPLSYRPSAPETSGGAAAPGEPEDDASDAPQTLAANPSDATATATAPAGAPVPASDSREGPAVELTAEFAGARHSWRGTLVRTEGEIDPRSRMVHAVAQVADPYGRTDSADRPPLAVGLFVEAEIMGRTIDRAVVLPRTALYRAEGRPGEDRPSGHHVLVIGDDDRIEFRSVEVVRIERERVVIRAGLEAGDRVCVSPLRAPVDGMAVRVAPEEESLAGVDP